MFHQSIMHYHPIRMEMATNLRKQREDANAAALQKQMLAMLSGKKIGAHKLVKDRTLLEQQSADEGFDDDATAPWRSQVLSAVEEARILFADRGKNIFDMSLVSSMLAKVDVDDVAMEDDTGLPYQAIYLHFGASGELNLGDGRWIDGAYAREADDGSTTLTFVANLPEVEITDQIPLGETHKRLTTAATMQFMRASAVADNVASLQMVGDPAILTLGATVAAAVRLAINSILYLNLPRADVELDFQHGAPSELVKAASQSADPGRATKATKRLEGLGYLRINFVGRGHAKAAATAIRGEGRASVEPHWRRGHWRRVVVGVGRTGREWRLFKPTVVNPKGAAPPTRGRIHMVQPRPNNDGR